jgi:lipid-A-disaccharide synthase
VLCSLRERSSRTRSRSEQSTLNIFLSAGEPSGDLHAANLAAELRRRLPHADLVGFGGDRMAAAGVRLLYPLTNLAVMWLGRVLQHLPTFFHLGAKAESFFRTRRPAALVLIDYPGFHWHLAQRAHRYGVPVYYFVPPQLWAWAGHRVKKVKRDFTAVLTAMPFEDKWYADRGVRTHYVGHPYFDEIAAQQLDDAFVAEQRSRPGELVSLLPGSRTQEVTQNLPMMVSAAKRIAAARPAVRFAVAAYKAKQAEFAHGVLADSGLSVEVWTGRTPELIEACTCCIAVSGSVGLELLARLKPTVVVYRMGKVFHKVARALSQVDDISLVNLLAGERIFPEFAVSWDASAEIAERVLGWLADPVSREAVVRKLEALKAKVAVPGAVERAAEFLVNELASASNR